MRKLERGPAPACLSRYRHGANNWNDLTADDRKEIWHKLDNMQHQRCAYCEGNIRKERHIEHFRQRGRDPRVIFLWSNLFGSCNELTSCGKYKDKLSPYDPADVIKPDEEDPEHFFLFVSDGSVAVREGLSPVDKRRANETIRIFNLNGILRANRRSVITGYVASGMEFMQMMEGGLTRDECAELYNEELAAIENHPFSTAIRHTLMPI